MKWVILLVVFVNSFICSIAQYVTVIGKVIDDKGSAVAGASVIEKSTKKGTSASADGTFNLTVKPGAMLVVSAVGFEEKQVKASANVAVILLADSKALSEVVVTALGIKRKKNELPYAAQQISGSAVSENRSSNFVGNLAGQASGLSIAQNNGMGASTNVVIRGFKSLTGNNQALFVIDGVPIDNSNTNTSDQKTGRGGYDYGNAANDINPDDFESVNILKGAAASALYGSRASNGVVLIVTKKGAKGKKAMGITINSGVTVGNIDKTTFPNYQNKYGAGYGYYYEDIRDSEGHLRGHFLYRDPTNFSQLNPINNDKGVKVVPMSEDASYGEAFDSKLLVYQWDAFDPTSKNYRKATPWVAASNGPSSFFTTAVSTNVGVNLDGSNDKGWYKMGYTRASEEGILPNSSIKKNLLNFGAAYNVTEKLTATANVSFSNINGLGRYGTGYGGDYSKNPMTNFRQWWQVNVDVKDLKDAYFRTRSNVTWNWADPTDLTPIYWNNPYFDRYENFETDVRNRYISNATLSYKLAKWVDILGRISLDNYAELQNERYSLGSVGVSGFQTVSRTFSEYNYDLLANFDKRFSTSFTLKGTVGMNIRRTTQSSILAHTNGGLSNAGIFTLANSVNAIEAPEESASEVGVDGVFASTTLGYNNYLFLDLAIRQDKASTLPITNNVYNYPSASVSWLFSKKLRLDWVTTGKLRANYAKVGNPPGFAVLKNYYGIRSSFNGIALTSSQISENNPNIKPEKTKSFEVGIDLSFLKNKLGVDVTYYNTKTVDQIFNAPVSSSTGKRTKLMNAGTIENKGLEVTAYATPIATKSFSWNILANWTKNTSKVLDLGGLIDNLMLADFRHGITVNASVGEAYGTIKGSNFVYKNGQRVVNQDDGSYEFSATSDQIIGNINPDWFGSITNTFRYKNVAISFLIDTKQGGNVFSLDMYYGLSTGLYPETVGLNDKGVQIRNTLENGGGIIRQGVDPSGNKNKARADAANSGTYGYDYTPAAGFVYDASYVKLRQIILTYTIPQSVISKIGYFKGIDVSLIARNPWIINKKLPYADPEDGVSSGNYQGFQVGSYPSIRSFGCNVKLKL